MTDDAIEAVARALRLARADLVAMPFVPSEQYVEKYLARAAIAAMPAQAVVQEPVGLDLHWQRRETRVYFRGEFEGGFDVRNCPEPERLAQAIVDAMNAPVPVPQQEHGEVERLRTALEEIRDQDPIDLVLDPEWSVRIARAALRSTTGGE